MPINGLNAARVLIADDHKAFGLMIAAIVRAGLTAEVAVVQTVEAALDALDMEPPDILITDLRFGATLGGLELIRSVRAHDRFDIQILPILVLSANAEFSTVKRARALGVSDFLSKPISPSLLLQRLHAVASAGARIVTLPADAVALQV